MALLIILIISEVLTWKVIRQHYFDNSWMSYYFAALINSLISLWLWVLWFKSATYNGLFDEPGHIWLLMNLAGMIFAVVIPRLIMCAFHFTGRFLRKKTGSSSRILTNTGITISVAIMLLLTLSTIKGRFNFKTEEFTIKIEGLKPELEGLKIVQISDIHLPAFYHHPDRLEKVMTVINSLKPDLIINTGDFVTYGWREFGRSDTIIRKAVSRYGSFAVAGNHDFGTYHPDFTSADRKNNVLLMDRLITSSGYVLLNDTSRILTIGTAEIGIAGVITKGSFPDIIHGNLDKAIERIDSADLKILLSHDPNHWDKSVKGKTDIDITFSGHTHGMQVGILTRKIKWSPAKFFYPRWNGLYSEKDQHLVVNRGLGVLGIPFRIWMPPEITLITLKGA